MSNKMYFYRLYLIISIHSTLHPQITTLSSTHYSVSVDVNGFPLESGGSPSSVRAHRTARPHRDQPSDQDPAYLRPFLWTHGFVIIIIVVITVIVVIIITTVIIIIIVSIVIYITQLLTLPKISINDR